jgi:hypothetical protein
VRPGDELMSAWPQRNCRSRRGKGLESALVEFEETLDGDQERRERPQEEKEETQRRGVGLDLLSLSLSLSVALR